MKSRIPTQTNYFDAFKQQRGGGAFNVHRGALFPSRQKGRGIASTVFKGIGRAALKIGRPLINKAGRVGIQLVKNQLKSQGPKLAQKMATKALDVAANRAEKIMKRKINRGKLKANATTMVKSLMMKPQKGRGLGQKLAKFTLGKTVGPIMYNVAKERFLQKVCPRIKKKKKQKGGMMNLGMGGLIKKGNQLRRTCAKRAAYKRQKGGGANVRGRRKGAVRTRLTQQKMLANILNG